MLNWKSGKPEVEGLYLYRENGHIAVMKVYRYKDLQSGIPEGLYAMPETIWQVAKPVQSIQCMPGEWINLTDIV